MGMTWQDWVKIGTTVAAPIVGNLAGRNARNNANQASGGARLQELMPQILQMVQQQQGIQQQNYGARQQQYAANQPLQDAIRNMAMGMMPTRYTQGAGGPAPQAAASTPSMPMQAPVATGDILDDYGRRGGGTGGAGRGALSGAGAGATAGSIIPGVGTLAGAGIGGTIGAIRGAMTKRASTAPTDFNFADARDAVRRAYQAYLGRSASDGEILTHLRNVGWQPGDQYVGDAGLRYILSAIQQSAEAGHRG